MFLFLNWKIQKSEFLKMTVENTNVSLSAQFLIWNLNRVKYPVDN